MVFDYWVVELLMGFKDVAFLPSRGSFSTTFFPKCGDGESLFTTTSLKVVVGVSKNMLHVKYVCSNKASFVSVTFHSTVAKMR